MSKYKLKRLFALILLPITYIMVWIAKNNTETVERFYSQGFYSVVSSAINTIMSFFSFSVAEVIIVVSVLAGIIYLIFTISAISGSKKEDRMFILYRFLANVLVIFSFVVFLFNVTCGINYYRTPFVEQINLNVTGVTSDELYALATSLAGEAAALREQVKLDENGIMTLSGDTENTLDSARKTMNSMAKEYPILGGMYFQPKPVRFSKLMSKMGIGGVFFPFTYEPNINVDAPHVKQPHTMVHELSHLRGFMQEDEANFIAYLACMSSEDPDFRYSGTISALDYVLNAVYKSDKDKYFEIRDSLPQGILDDLQNNSEYWQSFEGTINTVSSSINDTYLKANNQKDGVDSYGAMVDLIVAYRKQNAQ